MGTSDIIQIGILCVLAFTLIAIWLSMKAQWKLLGEQKKLTAAELLRGRYEMFFAAWDVTEEDVRQFKEKRHLYTEGMEDSTYENYKRSDDAIKDYLVIVQLYEYLAFAHTLNTSSEYLGPEPKADDPYGRQWVERWIKILIEDDEDFPHVHESYEKDHPDFHKFVEDWKTLNQKTLIPREPRFSWLREDKPRDREQETG